jgi:TM2 domain-containing membrane protein YozV
LSAPTTKPCPNCGALIDAAAEICPNCGVKVASSPQAVIQKKSVGIASAASIVFPGLGQIYNGQVLKGAVFVIFGIIFVTPIVLLFSGSLTRTEQVAAIFYPLFLAYNFYDAYRWAKAWPEEP